MLWRLDRIGRQIEAASPDIRVEVAELLGIKTGQTKHFASGKKIESKPRKRRGLIYWGVVIALYVGWQVIKSQ